MTIQPFGPFLTDIDKRAEVKGSRDPLGIQAIWSRLGRYVVGNLTTVTTSVRDFSTLLIGLHIAERVAELEPQKSSLVTFLQWEQLAGYARSLHGDITFRGTERVNRKLEETTSVTLSADRRDQILADQKITGIWGLYTVAARASGLVEGDTPRLTPAARDLVEHVYLPRMTTIAPECHNGEVLVKLLRNATTRVDLEGKHTRLAKAIAETLGPKLAATENEVLRKHLVWGGPDDTTEGRQRELAELFLLPPFIHEEFRFTQSAMSELERRAAKNRPDGSLATCLRRIRHCETVVAPAAALFSFILARHDAPVDDVAASVRETWSQSMTTIDVDAIRELKQDLATASSTTAATRWIRVAECMCEGDYGQVVRLLLEQNKSTMQSRGGAAPWVEERKGKLFVRFHGDRDQLPSAKELPDLWTFAYFLNSLRIIAIALHKGTA